MTYCSCGAKALCQRRIVNKLLRGYMSVLRGIKLWATARLAHVLVGMPACCMATDVLNPPSQVYRRSFHSSLAFHHLPPRLPPCSRDTSDDTSSPAKRCNPYLETIHKGSFSLPAANDGSSMSSCDCRTLRSKANEGWEQLVTSRRTFFLDGIGSYAAAAIVATTSSALTLPEASFAAANKRSIEDVKNGVEADFVNGRYYVTGDLTPSLYRPDCLFTDPTTRVASVEKYTAAVKLLFDPDNAQVDLLSLEVQDDNHIFAKWRLQGYLKFPWHPYVAPYTGTTLYTLDSEGLISRHEETWSISALDAARATITPTAGPKAKRPS